MQDIRVTITDESGNVLGSYSFTETKREIVDDNPGEYVDDCWVMGTIEENVLHDLRIMGELIES